MFKKSLRSSIIWIIAAGLVVLVISQFPDRSNEAANAYQKGDFPLAAKYWRKLARLGDDDAQYNLAALYSSGLGIDSSEDQAHKWFLKAAEAGHPAAQFEVSKTYQSGSGVAPSPSLALMWISESAEAGYVPAQIALGLKYLNGTGVQKDQQAATFWLSRAAGSGDFPPVLLGNVVGVPCVGT